MNDPKRFDPASVGIFRVTDRSFDRATGTVTLGYALGETITSSKPSPSRPRPRRAGAVGPDVPGLDRALLHLHVAAGTSYYKAAAPPWSPSSTRT